MTKHRKPTEIITTELCSYGCGSIARFENISGALMCNNSSNKCPINKAKNSDRQKECYRSGRNAKAISASMSKDAKDRQCWNRGKTKETDQRLMQVSINTKAKIESGELIVNGHPCSLETREKISEARVRLIAEGRYDSSGRKGFRGHYDGMYFHSSWELAFYVWQKECYGKLYKRNSKIILEYISSGVKRKYIPDFVDEDGALYEIKGYLFSKRDFDKYEQTNKVVNYLFNDDLSEALKYCKGKYGRRFYEVLYLKTDVAPK